MYNNKKILCIIPARGGSKRLPGKNIKLLKGKPLIAYSIAAAKGSKYLDRVIVSTDDEAIASVAKEYGAEVPFMRPSELATDTATTLSVLQHAVRFFEEKGEKFECIVLIQPTVPGIMTSDIDTAIETLFTTKANSCISMCEITDRPEWMYSLSEEGHIAPYVEAAYHSQNIRSQDLPKLYRINGAVYVTPRNVLMEEGKIIDKHNCAGVLMPRERSTDIDTLSDFVIAEMLMQQSQ